ncbi:MAG: hypothetical protein HYT76_01460 [Deltaproteobacteria bacterium]|nr:hypothetical protein [Deltaproteobacteria bacterium]
MKILIGILSILLVTTSIQIAYGDHGGGIELESDRFDSDTDTDGLVDDADRSSPLDSIDERSLMEYITSCEYRAWITRQFCEANHAILLAKDPNYCNRRAERVLDRCQGNRDAPYDSDFDEDRYSEGDTDHDGLVDGSNGLNGEGIAVGLYHCEQDAHRRHKLCLLRSGDRGSCNRRLALQLDGCRARRAGRFD